MPRPVACVVRNCALLRRVVPICLATRPDGAAVFRCRGLPCCSAPHQKDSAGTWQIRNAGVPGAHAAAPAADAAANCANLQAARYLTPAMLKAARQRGMELCSIDYTRPLLEQGTFDAIVHKLRPNKGASQSARGEGAAWGGGGGEWRAG